MAGVFCSQRLQKKSMACGHKKAADQPPIAARCLAGIPKNFRSSGCCAKEASQGWAPLGAHGPLAGSCKLCLHADEHRSSTSGPAVGGPLCGEPPRARRPVRACRRRGGVCGGPGGFPPGEQPQPKEGSAWACVFYAAPRPSLGLAAASCAAVRYT